MVNDMKDDTREKGLKEVDDNTMIDKVQKLLANRRENLDAKTYISDPDFESDEYPTVQPDLEGSSTHELTDTPDDHYYGNPTEGFLKSVIQDKDPFKDANDGELNIRSKRHGNLRNQEQDDSEDNMDDSISNRNTQVDPDRNMDNDAKTLNLNQKEKGSEYVDIIKGELLTENNQGKDDNDEEANNDNDADDNHPTTSPTFIQFTKFQDKTGLMDTTDVNSDLKTIEDVFDISTDAKDQNSKNKNEIKGKMSKKHQEKSYPTISNADTLIEGSENNNPIRKEGQKHLNKKNGDYNDENQSNGDNLDDGNLVDDKIKYLEEDRKREGIHSKGGNLREDNMDDYRSHLEDEPVHSGGNNLSVDDGKRSSLKRISQGNHIHSNKYIMHEDTAEDGPGGEEDQQHFPSRLGREELLGDNKYASKRIDIGDEPKSSSIVHNLSEDAPGFNHKRISDNFNGNNDVPNDKYKIRDDIIPEKKYGEGDNRRNRNEHDQGNEERNKINMDNDEILPKYQRKRTSVKYNTNPSKDEEYADNNRHVYGNQIKDLPKQQRGENHRRWNVVPEKTRHKFDILADRGDREENNGNEIMEDNKHNFDNHTDFILPFNRYTHHRSNEPETSNYRGNVENNNLDYHQGSAHSHVYRNQINDDGDGDNNRSEYDYKGRRKKNKNNVEERENTNKRYHGESDNVENMLEEHKYLPEHGNDENDHRSDHDGSRVFSQQSNNHYFEESEDEGNNGRHSRYSTNEEVGHNEEETRENIQGNIFLSFTCNITKNNCILFVC